MWNILKEEYLDKLDCKIILEESFFVGDAAGRFAGWKQGRSADWSSVDHKFALNIGLKFYSPEEFFLNEPSTESYDLGRDPRTILEPKESKEFVFEDHFNTSEVIMIMAVGSPASGKSTFYSKHLKHRNIVYINRDTLKTIPKCVSLIRSSLSSQQSVYIDNTHPTKESREVFISIAKEFSIPVKCLHFVADEWFCKHLDVFRSITRKVDPLSSVAFNTFRSRYQPPNENEGFELIIQVPFVANFDCENERELFSNYLF